MLTQHLSNSYLADIFKLSQRLVLLMWKESQFVMLTEPQKQR